MNNLWWHLQTVIRLVFLYFYHIFMFMSILRAFVISILLLYLQTLNKAYCIVLYQFMIYLNIFYKSQMVNILMLWI